MEEFLGKVMTAAAVAALFAATVPLASAQPGAPSLQPQARQLAAVAFTLKSGQLQTSQLIGSTVYDVQNRSIGSVKDVLLDRSGKVDTVVLDVGSFLGVGGKYVAVALNDIKMDNDRLTLDRSKEDLQAAAPFPYEQADNTTRPATQTMAPVRTDTAPRTDTANKSDTTPLPATNR